MENDNRAAGKILRLAVEALRDWEEGRSTLDGVLDSLRFEARPERSALASLLFEYFRHKGFIDSLIAKHASKGTVKPELRRIVASAATQALFQSGIAPQSAVNVAVDFSTELSGKGAGGFVNAILRSILRESPKPPEGLQDFPQALADRWIGRFGKEEATKALKAHSENPPISFRLRANIPDAELETAGCRKLEGLDWTAPFNFWEAQKPAELFTKDWLSKGMIYIQDPATALPVSLAKPRSGMKALDLCAAPGGKSIMMKDLSPGAQIFAADRSARRLMSTASNFKQAGLQVPCIAADSISPPFRDASFDLILADVPCSNTGVGRRRPDAPWRFSKGKLEKLVKLQRRILESALRLLAPGGTLLYSTCSVEEEEGPGQTAWLLERSPSCKLISERLLLPSLRHDGAYAAAVSRG